ncbi:MAG: B12-binding domain-containing radical SAM protein [Actinobacteria bacterium]|nr:B12-binding domain-containing radical SAM protein [Actinomycetota bacterium]
MRVLFIHYEDDHYSREKPLEGYERMQFGISYISSVLRKEGHETRLAVPTRESDEVVVEHIREFNPGLICFTSVYSVIDFISELASRVKRRHPDLFLLIGGAHATLRPDECIESAFDAVCLGEGEYPTLELVEQLESGQPPGGIPNLYIRRGAQIERNEPRPFMEDIDGLPFPDREMWVPWLANPLSRPSILAGRGCPFQCTYCCNHALGRVAEGRYVRLRSPQNIVNEFQEIKRLLPLLVEAYLEIETLGANRKWALELCSALERMNAEFDVPIAFGANLRVTPNTDYEELFSALARSNFRFVNIGLESGSERIRRDVLVRNYSNEDIIDAVRTARKHGLEVGIYNLIGIPGETRKDYRETIRLNRVCQPDWFLLSVFFPYPGTRLYDTCLDLGLLDGSIDHGLERRRPVFDQPGFSKRQIRRRHTWSHLLFYGGHRPLKDILKLVFMTKMHSSHRLLTFWRALSKRFSPYKQFE